LTARVVVLVALVAAALVVVGATIPACLPEPPRTCGKGSEKVCPGGTSCVGDICIVDPGACGSFPSGALCGGDRICRDGECVDITCGDNIPTPLAGVSDEREEECDDGDSNSNLDPDRCRSTCVLPYCGDGIRDRDEEVECVEQDPLLDHGVGEPRAIALTHVDGDRDDDLITAYFDSTATPPSAVVWWQPGDGHGTFDAATGEELLRVPAVADDTRTPAFAVGDVDDDGDADVVLAVGDTEGKGHLHVLLHDPDGFTLLPTAEIPGPVVVSVVIADVDRGFVNGVDLLIGSRGHAEKDGGTGSLYFGPVRGPLPPAPDRTFPLGHLDQLAVADLDADGRSDLVERAHEHLGIYWGVASGLSPDAEPVEPAELEAVAFAVGEIDGVPGADLVFTGHRGTVAYGYEIKNGQRVAHPRIDGASGDALVVADVDGDSRDEAIVCKPGGVRILRAPDAVDNQFLLEGADHFIAGALEVSGIATADLTGDRGADLVATGTREGSEHIVVIRIGGGSLGPLRKLWDRAAHPGLNDVFVGDLDDDHFADLLGVVGAPQPRLVFAAGTSDKPTSFPSSAELSLGGVGVPLAFAVGDLDGDTKLDVAVLDGTNPAALSVKVLRSTAGSIASTATPVDAYRLSGAAAGIALGDLDGDGTRDVVAIDREHGRLTVLANPGGTGELQAAKPTQIMNDVVKMPLQQLELGDVDGERGDDCVVLDAVGTLRVLHGAGGTCGAVVLEHDGFSKVIIADLASGASKWVVAVDSSEQLHALGPGGTDVVIGDGRVGKVELVVADVNGDLAPDLVTAGAAIQVYLQKPGLSPPAFTWAQTVSDRISTPRAVRSADLDHDGLADLVELDEQGGVWFARGRQAR